MTDRTCQPVDESHFSADGSNVQAECINADCSEPDTFRVGECDSATARGLRERQAVGLQGEGGRDQLLGQLVQAL